MIRQTHAAAGALHGNPAVHYRKDIDGLRAVAILAVVGYHARIPGITGGFVGVDVFFVLSGFLITSLIASEIRLTGTVSLQAFYARRIRRLFPAMIVMVVATCVAGAFMLLPVFGEQQGLGRSAIATALYVSNIFFWLNSPGYFDSSAELMPLLHTWSLSVEEQFYLIWPPMVVILLFAGRRLGWKFDRSILCVVLAILLMSFAWSFHETALDPVAAFYLLPARAWELATGAALALWLPGLSSTRAVLGSVCSAVGIVAIAASVVVIDKFTAFPGYMAAVPTMGTALVVLGGHLAERNPVRAMLSMRPVVLVGLLSYSWYLWHWPLLALARAYALAEHDPFRDIAVVVASFLVAYVSYRYVENPIRFGRPGPFRSDRSTLAVGFVACVVTCLPAAVLIAAANRTAKLPSFVTLQAAKDDRPPLRSACHQELPYVGLRPAEPCTSGQPGRASSLVLWGDSHADQMSPLMQAFAESSPMTPILSRSFARCPPFSHYPKQDARDEAGCDAFNAAVLEEITVLRTRGLRGVVLSARWLRVFGAPSISQVRIGPGAVNRGLKHAELAESLLETVDRLRQLGLRVLIIAPMPEMPYDVPSCLARRDPQECNVRRDIIEVQRHDTMEILRGIRDRVPGVRLLDVMNALCDDLTCFARRDGLIQFVDDDHLAAGTSRRLLPVARAALLEAAGGH